MITLDTKLKDLEKQINDYIKEHNLDDSNTFTGKRWGANNVETGLIRIVKEIIGIDTLQDNNLYVGNLFERSQIIYIGYKNNYIISIDYKLIKGRTTWSYYHNVTTYGLKEIKICCNDNDTLRTFMKAEDDHKMSIGKAKIENKNSLIDKINNLLDKNVTIEDIKQVVKLYKTLDYDARCDIDNIFNEGRTIFN